MKQIVGVMLAVQLSTSVSRAAGSKRYFATVCSLSCTAACRTCNCPFLQVSGRDSLHRAERKWFWPRKLSYIPGIRTGKVAALEAREPGIKINRFW